jgi:parallel beta-helix repeat protein
MPRLLARLGVLALVVVGCRDQETPSEPMTPSLKPGSPAAIVVRPGESIQAAIDQVGAGGRIEVMPGVYREALVISNPGVRLAGVGDGDAVIENPGTEENGIVVTAAGTGVVIEHLVVRNFEENGIFLDHVNGFVLRRITAQNNGEYGLFPVFSTNGRIESCQVSGHSDTGIYVGQSTDVTIDQNVAFGNVNGIEVENASDVRVRHNDSHGNTAGIVVVLLPGLTIKAAAGVVVADNQVMDNNLPNFGGGGFEAIVPAGTGILVIGIDEVTVERNEVRGNQFVGIAVANTGLVAQLAGVPLDVEPFPDGTRVIGNTVLGNGGSQPIPFLPAGTDLLWDGTGTGSCWERNRAGTTLNLDLLGGQPSATLPACR